ncbi:Hypothetical predicted protein [Pelobates cultripes]|uniref:Uncharacterized protein n=1 Tax=Pelobates cultripes TaxID=61616 RepID=A0AAD1SVD4_PELCU|nr:Hypothetical predicted protein [Pelobates cultripes]
MDGFLTPAKSTLQEAARANVADSPTRSMMSDGGETTLADIRADIRALAENMVMKDDLHSLSDTLHAAIRTEVTLLRSDMTAHDSRLQHLETTTQAYTLAKTRQENMLLALRRHTEDLDNRGRRSNIRVRGLPEPAGEEDVEAILGTLFRGILGAEAPATIEFDRAHRANRLRTTDGHEILYAVCTNIS